MTYFLPNGAKFSSAEVSTGLKIEMHVSSGLEWVCEKGVYMHKDMTQADIKNERIQNALDYVRICPSKEGPETSMYCGMVFGAGVMTMMEATNSKR